LGVVNNSIICDHSLTYEDSSGKHCSKCGQQLI
jgi:hypothetical protein